MIALSDQSNITNERAVWVFILAVAVLLFGTWLTLAVAKALALREEYAPALPLFRPCQVTTACPFHATELVMDVRGGGLTISDACHGCAAHGVARRWWTILPSAQA